MSIQRYRISQIYYQEGNLFAESKWLKYDGSHVHINYQKHGRGGWCKWDQIKELHKENERLKKELEEMKSKEYKSDYVWKLREGGNVRGVRR